MDTRRIILAIVMLFAAGIIFTQVRKLATPPPPPPPPTVAPAVVEQVKYADILVAATEVSFGAKLGEDSFAWKAWPLDAVTPDFINKDERPTAIEELMGGVTKSIIYEGEPITDRKIVMPGSQGLMASLLTPGMRAVTTRISVDSAAGGFIQPGDRVDIILTSATEGAFTSETIFENIRVLAIDQTYTTTSDSGAYVIGSTATFEMTQTDAEFLRQSVSIGDLTLTLRPIGQVYGQLESQAKTRSRTGSLTVYRNGQAQQVAIKE